MDVDLQTRQPLSERPRGTGVIEMDVGDGGRAQRTRVHTGLADRVQQRLGGAGGTGFDQRRPIAQQEVYADRFRRVSVARVDEDQIGCELLDENGEVRTTSPGR